jgi:hypothetical protein
MLKKTITLVLVLVVASGITLVATRSSTFSVKNSLLMAQDPAEIWRVLATVERWPQWWPGVEKARLDSTLAEGQALELAFMGNPADGPARIDRCRTGLELTFSRDGVLWSRAGTSLRLEPQRDAVLVTVESMVRGPQAFLARFTGRETFSVYHRRLLDGLSEQARQAEIPVLMKEPSNGR